IFLLMNGTFIKTVTDIDGHTINVKELSRRYVLILITLKSTSCPVCPQLLLLLNLHGLQDNPPAEYRDPFDYSITCVPPEEILINRLLLKTDAYFIILCPGPVEDARRIRETCNFPYPFIVDEDLSLAESIRLRLSYDEMLPYIGHIYSSDISVRTVCAGRFPSNYGHDRLLAYLRDYRVVTEENATKFSNEAMELITCLKKSELLDDNEPNEYYQYEPQLETEHKVVLQKQLLPVELLSQIFEYIETWNIVKIIMTTCRQWRSIGFEVIVTRMKQQAKSITDSVVIYSRSTSNNLTKL
ncbi:15163_t:CDS:2, partial [Acaulospora morrowiae]